MPKKAIIVGGVAGGASAAARLRRLDEEMEIVMVERGEYVSFANCGLPYYIGGVITERDELLVQTVDGMSDKFKLDIRVRSEVTQIYPDTNSVRITDQRTGKSYEEGYDYLILSPGASPIKPPIPGLKEADNVFTLRTIPDTDEIKSYVKNNRPQTAVVIGGGFIGLETAENLHNLGLQVSLVEMADQVMAPLDFEMASILHLHLKAQGINLVLGDGVNSFADQGQRVILQSGKELPADLIILAIGVKPENDLAKKAGLTLGERGGIKVNSYLQTSVPNIYAIGDVIEVEDYVSGKSAMIPLAGPANKQGRIVANNIAGNKEKYQGTLGTAVAKVFDYTVAATGNNEKTLKRLGLDYEVLHIHPSDHASYYPNASQISIKLVFHPQTGKIYGAQAVGLRGVEKRIDVLATAMRGGLGVEDLTDLELAYAPPYSSAKDPVNMLGFAASNIIQGYVKTIQWHEMPQLIEQGAYVLDVRDPKEREFGYLPGSVNIPLDQLRSRIGELPTGQDIYIYCQVGIRGYLAVRILEQAGFSAFNLDGGFQTYAQVSPGQLGKMTAATTVDDSGFARGSK